MNQRAQEYTRYKSLQRLSTHQIIFNLNQIIYRINKLNMQI